MSIKISELPEATTVGQNDFLPIVQGGTTKKVAASELGGTNDYENLENKPQINGVPLSGNKTTSDLSLQTKLTTDLTADLYLVDGTAPALTDGKYFTNGHKVYVNGTEFAAFNNCIFGYEYYSDEDIYTFIKSDETGYAIINYYDDQYSTAISSQLLLSQIDTTIPTIPRNTRIPSTKLLYDKLEEKQTEINELQAENEQLLSQIPTATATGNPINVQDSSNLPIKDFALGGNAVQSGTPTPDSPQDIHVVTGDNTLKVVGKNLFCGTNETGVKYYRNDLSSESTLARNSTLNSVEIRGANYSDGWSYRKYNFKGNTTYTIRVKIGIGDNPLLLLRLRNLEDTDWLSEKVNNLPLGTYNAAYKGWYINMTANAEFVYTFTIPECLYFHIGFVNKNTSGTNWQLFSDIQLEENSTATTYEPYTEQTQLLSLGDIELARIPDTTITDVMFKAVSSNNPLKPSYYDTLPSEVKASLTLGSWYKQGNIANLLLNGTQSFTKGGSDQHTENTNLFYINTDSSSYEKKEKGVSNIICNRFETRNVIGATHDYTGVCGLGTNSYIYFRIDQQLTAQQFQTWVGENNIQLYYQKATPTYTEITDTTLIGQLENILAMHTNKNVTNFSIVPTGTNAEPTGEWEYRVDLGTVIGNINNAIISLGGNV